MRCSLRERVKDDVRARGAGGNAGRRRGRLALAALTVALTAATPTIAAAADPYGETHRFGSFDSTYYNNGGYDGNGGVPAAGKFVDPAAFAVDVNAGTAEGTAVYVLDRTSPRPSTQGAAATRWRLQKLSSRGEVLGVAAFSLPGNASDDYVPQASSLVVDHPAGGGAGRVVLLLRSSDGTRGQEIVAWSTEATGGKLDAPAGLTADAYTTPLDGSNAPGVLSSNAQLESSGTLDSPRGLAVVGTGATRALAVLSQRSSSSGTLVTTIALQSGGGDQVGDKLDDWASSSLAGEPNAPGGIEDFLPVYNGLSSNADGSLTLSIADGPQNGQAIVAADTDVVHVDADLGGAKVLASPVNAPFGDTGYIGLPFWNVSPWQAIATPQLSGLAPAPQVVGLPNDRYAALFGGGSGTSWIQASTDVAGVFGVRLLSPIAAAGQSWDGTLSSVNVPVSSIVNTIGSPTGTGNCALTASADSFTNTNVGTAAGRDGAIWVFVGGSVSTTVATRDLVGSRYLVELTPGARDLPCAQPSGTFGASAGGRALDASRAITVQAGTRIDFDGTRLGYAGAWVTSVRVGRRRRRRQRLRGRGTFVQDDQVSTAQPLAPTASQTYTRPGTVTVRMRATGDFGVTTRETTVTVQSTTPPQAAFSASTTNVDVGQSVAFDASGSRASPDTRIVNYHWDYGDGVSEDSSTPQIDHAFSSAGAYDVKLTVRGSDNQVSAVATRQVTVKARAAGPGPGPGPGPWTWAWAVLAPDRRRARRET